MAGFRERVTVPGLRDDFRVRRTRGGDAVVEDTLRHVRVPVDELGLSVLGALAGGPATPGALCKEVGAPRAAVFERVALLNRHLLLDTPRARDQVALSGEADAQTLWPLERAADAPLTFPPDLAHGCVACGACCTGTDIGPIPERDVAKVRERDWSPHLPEDVTPEDWLRDVRDTSGREVVLLGMRQGRCVFLGEDKLCTIHRVAGAAQKPTICRQFPYSFTRTPRGIDVSFSMECRSWWRARRRGEPVADSEGELRVLLEEGAPVLDLPLPVPVWDGLDWGADVWLDVRAAAVEAVRVATTLGELVAGFTDPVIRALQRSMQPYRDSEVFATREGWGIPAPGGPGGDSSSAMNFLRGCDVTRRAVAEGLGDLTARYTAVYDQAQTDRVRRLAWVLDHVLAGNRLDDIAHWSHELEVWRDMALGALYAHEPARRIDVLTGTALLALRVVVGSRLAGLLARGALRARTTEQDVVDSMVVLTKMLRGTAFLALFRRNRRHLVDLFLFNSQVFIQGTAPTPPEAGSLLPGAT